MHTVMITCCMTVYRAHLQKLVYENQYFLMAIVFSYMPSSACLDHPQYNNIVLEVLVYVWVATDALGEGIFGITVEPGTVLPGCYTLGDLLMQ